MTLEELNRYDRATVALWRRSHAELSRQVRHGYLSEAAAHAILTGLRRCADASALFTRYEADVGADFALITSLAPPGPPGEEWLWQVRDAAFYLRWQELNDRAG